MMHHNRRYSVREVSTVEELTETLTKHDWCGCSAFKIGEFIFANDSTSADGAQEYGVIWDGKQIESLTVSWMSHEDFHKAVLKIIEDPTKYGAYGAVPSFDHPQGPCRLCA